VTTVWGIHNNLLTTELIDGSFISIGWSELGDLTTVGSTREAFKAALTAAHPDAKPQTIAAWAGVPFRFTYELQVGDVVVAPYRPDGTINLGVVSGPYYFVAGAEHPHRRAVTWKKLGVPRSVFSQPALYEIGSAITLFAVKKHTAEFLAALGSSDNSIESVTEAVEKVVPVDTDEPDEEPRASRIERHTRDFVLERLKEPHLSHRDFEEFTADLLRALGYQSRVTAYAQDGGVDVIAHRDPLGIEPPLIKVQCKHTTASMGAPQVQQLVGTLAANELGVFVTLGAYTKEAQSIENQQQRLRLINGEALVDLILANYAALAPLWRSRIPLRSLLVVDDAADS
jgi:restriction system protein